MTIALECINLIIPIAVIEKKHPGGWQAFLAENPDLPSDYYDQHLLRLGAMSPLGIQLLVDDWKEKGFKPHKTVNGIKHWKDMCVVDSFSGPALPCAWLEFDADRGTVSLAESDHQNNLPLTPSTIMSDFHAQRLWTMIQSELGKWKSTWKTDLDALEQVDKVGNRKKRIIFSDADIFKGLLRSLLSNSVDWSRVQKIQDYLPELFEDYSFESYANKDENYARTVLIPQLKALGHSSQMLGNDLSRLIKTARKLQDWKSTNNQSQIDSFFDSVIEVAKGNLIEATRLLGTDSIYKLYGFGIPLAAEAMKNIGYEVAKPDRHICRAMGCFELVKYKKWPDMTGTKAPVTTDEQLIITMNAMQDFALKIDESPSYIDQVIWLLCAQSGPHFSNKKLTALYREAISSS